MTHEQIVSELADPHTSAERLHQLASAHPEFGPQIASHPNCYPELREWVLTLSQQALPAEASGSPQQTLAITPKRSKKALGVALAIILPAIAVASVAIPFIANLSETESSADTIRLVPPSEESASEISMQVIGEVDSPTFGNTDWFVRADAPIETFPLDAPVDAYGTYGTCSEAQFAWLEQHGGRIGMSHDPGAGLSLTLHNSSTTGASMPIGNIRFEGKEVESVAFVSFQCPAPGRGDAPWGQPLLIGVTGDEALYGEALGVSGDGVQPEGSPVTLNLAPGEVSVLKLTRDDTVDTQRRYEGRIVADLIDGSNETLVLAEDVVFYRAPVPNFYVGYEPGYSSNVFVCASPAFSTEVTSWGWHKPRPCSLAEAAAMLQEAAAAGQ